MSITYEEALRIANDTWQGLYRLYREHDGWFRVLLHSPTGPIHWITNKGKPYSGRGTHEL